MMGAQDFFYNTISTGNYFPDKARSRRKKRQLPSHIGIDKLHISIPLVPEDTDGSSVLWKKKGLIQTSTGLAIAWVKAHIEIAERVSIEVKVWNHGSTAEIEFNPSRIMDAQGSSLCSIEVVEDTLKFVLRYLSNLITPAWFLDRTTGVISENWPQVWLNDVVITRLDIAADITPGIPFSVSKVLQQVANPLKRLDATYNRGICNSLTWGSHPWIRQVFYNKGAHPLHKNSQGVFRFEIQLHREVLKKWNLRCLTNVTAKKVMEIVESRFNKSRLGLPFSINGGLSHLCQALESTVSVAKANGFLGVALRMSKIGRAHV